MNSHVVTLAEDENGDLILPLSAEILAAVGWVEGDTITWGDNGDGTFSLTKSEETEIVLVECVSTFRMRYLVEVPKGKADWALDTVTMNEAEEFSQTHLGEQIVSSRVVTVDEAIDMFDAEHPEFAHWADDRKLAAATKI